MVTDYGVAVNPRRPDLLEALKAADCIPLKTIQELRGIAYSIVGEPEKVQFADRVVGIIEARDKKQSGPASYRTLCTNKKPETM